MGVVQIDNKGLIRLRNQCIGYLSNEDHAVVDSSALGSYANRWLMQHGYKVDWQRGVSQKLEQEVGQTTRVRVYQLAATAPAELNRLTYDQQLRRYGGPDLKNYVCVFDGDMGTNDAKAVCDALEKKLPNGYNGEDFAMTDIIEMYDATSRKFFFVDEIGLRETSFAPQQQNAATTHKLLM